MRELCFIESDHARLAAAIDLPEGSGPLPAVLVMHGLTGSKLGKAYHLVEFATMLAESGIACIRFDQAGCGDSTGRFVDLNLPTMVRDAQAVALWMMRQTWVDRGRIGLVGLSLGALPTVVIDAEIRSQAVALWAGVYDLPEVFAATTSTGLSALLKHQGWVPYRGLSLGKTFFDSLDAVDASSLLMRNNSPLLLAHSPSDAVVPFGQSDRYATRCAELERPCQRLTIAGADHDFADFAHRQQLLTHTVSFMQQCLNTDARR